MAFQDHQIDTDTTFGNEADPVLSKIIKRTAGAQVIQDIALNTYYGNTVGKTKYPGIYDLHKKELADNLAALMSTKMSYRELEDFLVMTGYEAGDIRHAFKSMTSLDPVQLEYMRTEDVKNTPPNIPWFNLGWGHGKKKDVESYFIMPMHSGTYTVFAQVDDMTRNEVGTFLRKDEALEHLGTLVKSIHRYDKSAAESVEDGFDAVDMTEPDKPIYRAVANRFYDLESRGILANEYVYDTVKTYVTAGKLTEEDGKLLIKKYAAEPPAPPAPDMAQPDEQADDTNHEEIKEQQGKKNVIDELKKRTPQDFFQAQVPDRIEEIATEQIKSVLVYISNRESDIESFDVSLHSLQYMKHETQKIVGPKTPETEGMSGAPKATISAILEIKNDTMPEGKNKKFALAVFFVGSTGEVTTSDSIKGEDDIIYGFTEEGLAQYFSRSKKSEE